MYFYLINSWDSKINLLLVFIRSKKREKERCWKSNFSSLGAPEILPSSLFFFPLLFQRVCNPFDPFSRVKRYFIFWFHHFVNSINKESKWATQRPHSILPTGVHCLLHSFHFTNQHLHTLHLLERMYSLVVFI